MNYINSDQERPIFETKSRYKKGQVRTPKREKQTKKMQPLLQLNLQPKIWKFKLMLRNIGNKIIWKVNLHQVKIIEETEND